LYESALTLIRREFATKLDLQDIASRLYTSRRQLQRVFGDAGTSFRTEIRRARMTAAAEILRNHPEVSVREISEAVGYRQPAQFAKAFRAVFGRAPIDYRRMQVFAVSRQREARRRPGRTRR